MGWLTRKRVIVSLLIIAVLYVIIRLLHGSTSTQTPTHSERRTPGAPVLVMVFYEALCPDSKHFIIKQLVPAYKKAPALIDYQLIPYGKASTRNVPDGYEFVCQHGSLECEANTYHACVIEVIEDAEARLDVVACMIRDNRQPKEATHKCCKQHNIENIDLIQKCYDSSHGAELLKLQGDATNALRPPMTFVPTITLDGSQGRQANILKDLFGEVCKIVGNDFDVCRHRDVDW